MSLSISTIAKENTEFISKYIQQIEKELQPSDSDDEELVRRAIFAVRNKFIYFDKFSASKSLLQITVQDVRPAKITINFQEDVFSCDCKKNGWCRHKVSALLALYQHIESVQDWLMSWRMKKNVSLEVLASERTPNSWKLMVNDVLSHYLKQNQKVDGATLLPILEVVISKLMKFTPFEREWKPIYKLFIEVYVLNSVWDYIEKTNSFVKSTHFEPFFDKQFESIVNSVEELKGQSRLFATDPFFDELQNIIRVILLDRKGYEERKLTLYLTFWDKIFTEKKRAIGELKKFEELSPTNVQTKIYSNIFFIILKNTDKLQRNIQSLKTNEVLTYFRLAKFALSRNNIECGEIILNAMLPHLYHYIHDHLLQQNRNQFVKNIHSLYEKISLSEHEESKLFSSYGPYGLQPYSDYLLKSKRYEEWVALHQINPSSISYLESIGLKEVLENKPAFVLPLLHYYAMNEINQKTRLNYKEAAVILKKMKVASQKAGKINFWNDYINYIQMNFKRLKAFREELEKENILV